MEVREVAFTVRFRPKLSWVDEIYLGNTLMELVGAWARNTGAFDFTIEKQEST